MIVKRGNKLRFAFINSLGIYDSLLFSGPKYGGGGQLTGWTFKNIFAATWRTTNER